MTEREIFDLLYEVQADGQAHKHPIDLDAMDVGDLLIAANHPALHADVKDYAGMRANAMSTRLIGQVHRANRAQKKLPVLKRAIPEGLRW